jgi:hypothetical protein
MDSQFEISSTAVSLRIVASGNGTSQLVISSDAPENGVWTTERQWRTVWMHLRDCLANSHFLNPRKRSLVRSNLLVFGSVCVAWPACQNPTGTAASLVPVATLLAILGTADAVRNLRKRWGLYHAGVMLMICADLMAVTLLASISLFRVFLLSIEP